MFKRYGYGLVMDESGAGGAGTDQGNGGGMPPNFDAWLTNQDDSVKKLVDGHVKGLKTALDGERTRSRDLERQLRDAAAKLEKGSDAEKRLTELANQAADATRQATFYDMAHAAGVTNLKLAWTAARADDLFKKDGTPDLGEEGRLVVFVDDLDRCLPEKAVEVLEAIKLFLDVPGTVFALGMDREAIRRGIETHYGAMLKTDGDGDEIPINGDVYLQKMIQIPFNLPPLDISGREKFIETLEETLPEDFRLEDVTRSVFARGLFPNPRQVKRALNVFYLLKQVAAEQEKHALIPAGVLAWPLLAKTVLIQSQWPELYKLWRQYPTLIQTLEEEYTRAPVSEQELLQGLQEEEQQPEAAGIVKAAASRERRATGLMAEFINNRQKYALLAEMLCYPEESGEGEKRARFSGLSRSQVQIYVGLVGALDQKLAESAPAAFELPADVLGELESGDPARIRDLVSVVLERDADPDGPQRRALRERLAVVAQNADLPPEGRVTAADAADQLGYIPADLYTFVPIPDPYSPQFLIAKYPVTNLQYERSLNSPDFGKRELWAGFPKFSEPDKQGNVQQVDDWGEEGWKWLQGALKNKDYEVENGVLYPRYWRDLRFGALRPSAPVVGVSWWESNAYCKWLLAHWEELEEAKHLPKPKLLRLPTEPEWVLAAGGPGSPSPAGRGQGEGRFAFGELKDVKELPRYANTSKSGIGRTTPVWMYPQGESPLHVMDMTGNVWEWQANLFGEGAIFGKEAQGLRGGSWNRDGDNARVSFRNYSHPYYRCNYGGFRVVAPLAERSGAPPQGAVSCVLSSRHPAEGGSRLESFERCV